VTGLQQIVDPNVIDESFFNKNILLCNDLINGLQVLCKSIPKDDKEFLGVLYDYCASIPDKLTNNPNEGVRGKNIKSMMHQYFTAVKGSMGNIESLKKASATLVMNIGMLPKEEN
jgi:hypothetical protein